MEYFNLILKLSNIIQQSLYHKLYYRQRMFGRFLRIARSFAKSELAANQNTFIDFTSLENSQPITQKQNDNKKNIHNLNIMLMGHKAAEKLNKYDSETLDNICREFLLYTSNQEVKKKVQDKITAIVGNSEQSRQCIKNLEVVYGILEQSNYFLKGDLHSHSLYTLEEYFKKFAETIQNDRHFDQRIMFQELFKIITSEQTFRLPKLGILDNESQNQKNLFQRQLILQDQCSSSSLRSFLQTSQYLAKIGRAHNTGKIKKLMVQWLPDVVVAVKQRQDYIRVTRRQQTLDGTNSVESTILKLEPVKLATISLVQFLKMAMFSLRNSDQTQEAGCQNNYYIDQIQNNHLCHKIGNAIRNQVQYQKSMNLLKQSVGNKQKPIQSNPQQTPPTPTLRFQDTKSNLGRMSQQDKRKYILLRLKHKISGTSRPSDDKTLNSGLIDVYELGSVFSNILKDTLKIQNKYGVMVPLLEIKYKSVDKNYNENHKYLSINSAFIDYKTQNPDDVNMLHLDKALPMIIKPSKWVDYEIGGYYLKPTTLVKIQNSMEQQNAIKHADLGRTFKIIDKLSSTSWKINKKVFAIVEDFWNRGGGVPRIPTKGNPNGAKVSQQEIFNYSGKQRMIIMKQIQKQKDDHSIRSDFLLKLRVIKSFQNIQKFYFPMNLDFRGRVYPIAPHFNHIGADLSRGLLKFGQKKKLSAGGLRWLKIHCANLMGQDKKPIKDKLIFIDNNLEMIKHMAENPLQNRQWLQNQDCWQSLSVIFELTEALKLDNPEQFLSDLHIHQDGSCNGLQHYAALGRDAEGAAQVNLDKRDLPGDVYTYVGRMVVAKVEQDALNPNSEYYQIANVLKDQIKRKTVKQTVMTSVYGVTFVGARAQIQRQLKDQKIFSDFNDQYKASVYLAKYTLQSLANLFSGANAIKKWLVQCASLICSTGSTVSWITPYGLPVVQPYRTVNSNDVVQTISEEVEVNRYFDEYPVNKSRQKSAFPPNFIHSLDSSHMIFTAEQCHKRNITFAAVHDSYWTHPSSVDQMNQVLREQFINLHSQPLLQNLRLSFQRRYPTLYFPPVPVRGDFNLERVKQSTYFFS